MRVLCYGGGAVGLGLASLLIESGAGVQIVARPATVEALRHEGLRRTGLFGEHLAGPEEFLCAADLAQLPHDPPAFALVCVKSYDTDTVAAEMARHAWLAEAADTTFVLCQNGWGSADLFAHALGPDRIYNARIITGFRRPAGHHVDITVHADAVRIGSLFGQPMSRVEPLCAALREGGIGCEATDTIERDLWAKMLYNCALNGLGAILGVPYGKLGEHAATRELMAAIVAETFAAMTAGGYRTHWPNPAEFLGDFYAKSLPATAAHEPSTLQDLRAGKSTEIDALNGAVAALAREHHLSAPYNLAVTRMVHFLEAARRLPRHDDAASAPA